MLAFTAVCMTLSFLGVIDLLSHLANSILTNPEHCLNLLPNSNQKPILEAVVCGRNLPKEQLYSALQTTGLLHLIVVSGAHLIAIEYALNKAEKYLRLPKWATEAFLIAYTFLTGFQAPLVRALFQRLFERLSMHFQLNHLSIQSNIISAWTLLAICPSWINSISFQLSWVASSILALKPPTRKGLTPRAKNLLRSNCEIYLALFPILAVLSPPHPLSILINTIAIPLMGGLIIPLSFFHCLVGESKMFDYFWTLFVDSMIYTQNTLKLESYNSISNSKTATAYTLFFTTALFINSFRIKRS